MPDVFDMAQQFDALNLEQGLQAQRVRASVFKAPAATGKCLNPDCDANPFDNPKRLFCDPACEREYSRTTTRH
jgi:hypothetical protein